MIVVLKMLAFFTIEKSRNLMRLNPIIFKHAGKIATIKTQIQDSLLMKGLHLLNPVDSCNSADASPKHV